MDRNERNQEIDFLDSWHKKAQVALCVDYRGLKVQEISRLRKELRQSGAVGKVVKNSLSRRASTKAIGESAEALKYRSIFKGPSLLVISESDPVAPAKVIAKFAKEFQCLSIKGAWLDGTFLDPKGVEELSKMPGKKEVLAQLLALLNTPATQLLRLMNAPAQQMMTVLEGHRKNLEAKAA